MSTALSTNVGSSLVFPQDIDIPRLNVIQKMSQIEAPIGAVTLDKDSVLLDAGERMNVVVVGAFKKWKENVPYDDDVIPKYANTPEEAEALAEESDYEILETADLVFLLPQNGDDDADFPYPIGDTNYQLGRLTVQKDAYRLTYKKVFTFANFNREKAPESIYWSFGTESMTKGKYSWYVPTLNPLANQNTPDEIVDFVRGIFQNS